MKTIPFNKPYVPPKSFTYIRDAIDRGKISGNGFYTQQCHHFFQERLKFKKVLLTTSGTDALEMAALLSQIAPQDEVIMPSFTFSSTANAFLLRGARIVFADSGPSNPNMDTSNIESLITNKTRAIVPVHYAGIACDMDAIMGLAQKYKLSVIEDAAHAVDGYYKNLLLGSIGHFAAFSFHETKNLSCGEGGLLIVNDGASSNRSEYLWEKGTNRTAFYRGEIDKYGWVDIGSSFLPSDLIAALLYAQLEEMQRIQKKRLLLWNRYYLQLQSLEEEGFLRLPKIPEYATHNAHLFYIVCSSLEERQELIQFLKERGVSAIFHYLPLHRSRYFASKHDGRELPCSNLYADQLLRLPLYYELSWEDVDFIVQCLNHFFQKRPKRQDHLSLSHDLDS